jgi:Ca2+-binding EF-hand superfamily protein
MMQHALRKVSDEMVPLTAYQIHSIMAVASNDQYGTIKYAQMVPVVAETLHKLTDVQHMKSRFQAIVNLSNTNLLKDLMANESAKLEQMLLDAFGAADEDGSGNLTGVL